MCSFRHAREPLRALHLAICRNTAGDLQGYQALCTPHVAPQASAMLASLVQPSSKFSVAAGIAAQQGTLWHALSSVISLSSTSSTVRPKSHTLSPLQLLTPTAARTQGTGSNAISASRWSLPQICPTTQAALSQGHPKGWHQQHLTAMMSQAFSTAAKDAPNKQENAPDISLLSPRVQSLWDHANNAHLGNVAIKAQSHLYTSWTCPECPDKHLYKWRARVADVTRGSGCPFCSGYGVCPHNSLACKAPHLIPEWDTASNLDSPHDYTSNSSHRAHWICQQGHQWQARINDRVKRKTGCPACVKARPSRRLPSLTASTSHVMQFWDWKKNQEAGLDPDKLTCGSCKLAHFECSQCPELQSHKWTTRVSHVVRGTGCPCCSSHKVCKCNSLATVRPDLAAEWCYAENKGTPDDYTSRSNEVVWWETAERGKWQASIDARSRSLHKPETLPPDLAAEWCYAKNRGTPDDYHVRSMKVVWWETAERGQWQASIVDRYHTLDKSEVA